MGATTRSRRRSGLCARPTTRQWRASSPALPRRVGSSPSRTGPRRGGLAKMFKVMAPYQPAPPPSSPFDWGDETRVRELLGEDFDLEIDEHVSTLRAPSAEDYWELFATSHGPTKTLAESIGERREDLHRDWVEFFETNYSENGEIAHTREYLLVSGIRR